jgi:hypothetical protein
MFITESSIICPTLLEEKVYLSQIMQMRPVEFVMRVSKQHIIINGRCDGKG